MKFRASTFQCGLPLFVVCCGVFAEQQPAYRDAAFKQHRHNATQLRALGDDAIHLLQSSVHLIPPPGNETALDGDALLQTPESLTMLEGMMVSYIHEGRFAGESKYVEAMKERVAKMKGNIVETHKANQKWVHKSIDDINKCNKPFWSVAYKKAVKLEERFNTLSKKHKECYESISDAADSVESYKVKYENAKAGLDVAVERIKDEEKKQSASTCKPGLWPGVTLGMRAQMLYTWFDKAYKLMVRLHRERKKKAKLTARFKAMYDKRRKQHAKLAVKCKKTSKDMDNTKCKAVTLLRTACKDRSLCYKRAVKAHSEADKVVKKEERDMQIEWRSLGRMDCYLGVINVKKEKNLNGCRKNKVSADHLKIKYGKIPKRTNCPFDPRCPCSKKYKAEHYGKPGLGTCTECPACKA